MNKEIKKRLIEQEKQHLKDMQKWWEQILPRGLLGQLVRKSLLDNKE